MITKYFSNLDQNKQTKKKQNKEKLSRSSIEHDIASKPFKRTITDVLKFPSSSNNESLKNSTSPKKVFSSKKASSSSASLQNETKLNGSSTASKEEDRDSGQKKTRDGSSFTVCPVCNSTILITDQSFHYAFDCPPATTKKKSNEVVTEPVVKQATIKIVPKDSTSDEEKAVAVRLVVDKNNNIDDKTSNGTLTNNNSASNEPEQRKRKRKQFIEISDDDVETNEHKKLQEQTKLLKEDPIEEEESDAFDYFNSLSEEMPDVTNQPLMPSLHLSSNLSDSAISNASSTEHLRYLPIEWHHEVQGLGIVHNFVSEDEEALIAESIFSLGWNPISTSLRFSGNRFQQHYGAQVDFVQGIVLKSAEESEKKYPEYSKMMIKRMKEKVLYLRSFGPDHQLNNLYNKEEGHYIYLHTDNRGMFTDVVVSVSLLGNCNMTFQHSASNAKGDHKHSGKEVSVYVPRRSLLLMTSDARYEWKHGISNSSLLSPQRISLTFRQTRTKKK